MNELVNWLIVFANIVHSAATVRAVMRAISNSAGHNRNIDLVFIGNWEFYVGLKKKFKVQWQT